MLESPPSIDLGFWVLSGFAEEWTADGVAEPGFSKIKVFSGQHGAGEVIQEFEKDGFDYVIDEALHYMKGQRASAGIAAGACGNF
ncbi:MAG TPA: hypothetical protein VMW57_00650 [Methyloceanibacter sp.]|nr:hypothetical protein [Methyloceanibacter sp.]